MNRVFPLIVFLFVLILLAGATLYYQPSWWLADDCKNLSLASEVWGSGGIEKLISVIRSDMFGWGIFRPFYWSGAAIVYHVFRGVPVVIYLLIIIFNMGTMLLWGLIFHDLFRGREANKWLNVFLFPVSFFIFTPFWNIFMTISIQEKFVVFYSALAVYFLKKGYEKGNYKYFFLLVISLIAGLLTKPTIIYITLVFCSFSFLDILLFRYKVKCSLVVFISNLFLLISYYLFTTCVQLGRLYTAKYKLSPTVMVDNILLIPAVLKIVVVIALLTIIFMTILIYTKKNRFSPLAIIIPSGYLCYLLVISPWGFPTYIYSPLTPYIMGIFFPLYVWLNNKTKVIKVVTNVMLVFLVSIACVAIIIPRIARMGDLRRAVEFITEFSGNNPGSVYFYPTPFPESAGSMKKLTQAEIILIAGGNLNKKLAGKPDSAYLLIENWCNPVTLQDVRVDELIYDGNTWKIFRLIAEDGYQEKFKVKFPQNIAQKTKNYFKRIK